MKLVYIKWQDAAYQDGDVLEEDAFSPEVLIESAGLLAREDDKTISLAIDHYGKDKTWRHVAHIPKILITERQDFEVKGKKK